MCPCFLVNRQIEKMHLGRIVKSILTLYHTVKIQYCWTMPSLRDCLDPVTIARALVALVSLGIEDQSTLSMRKQKGHSNGSLSAFASERRSSECLEPHADSASQIDASECEPWIMHSIVSICLALHAVRRYNGLRAEGEPPAQVEAASRDQRQGLLVPVRPRGAAYW